MKLMRNLLIGLAAMLTWVSLVASQERPKQPAPPRLPEGVRVLRDLQYVEHGHERNRLDLYLPEQAEGQLPLVVWIHGGGWVGGNKEGCPAVPLTTKGYAVASINYRLSQHAVFPAQIQDCKTAIRWLRANAAKYDLDPEHVGVWGASAGGHLVALLGLTAGIKEFEGNGGNLDQSSRVQAVIDCCGPSDLTKMGALGDRPGSYAALLIGGPAPQNLEKARRASPLSYVAKDVAPFLIIHGDKDTLLPLAQSEMLAAALQKVGAEVTFQVVKGGGHLLPVFTAHDGWKQTEDFFAKHLGKSRPVGKAGTQSPKKPYVAITISKETTYITEPLRKDGYVNYVAALNERFRAGVTHENNAAVPFLKAMGPGEIGEKYQNEYCRLLDIPPLPKNGNYFVPVEKYAKALEDAARPTAQEEKGQDIYSEQLTSATKRPWSTKEFPILAGWLATNEKPLALLLVASKRPRRYDPLIPENGCAIGALLPAVSQYREALRALTARAMLRVSEDKVDEAWEDLLACHRLARLVGQGPTLIETLVAIAVDRLACGGDQGLLQHAQFTPTQIARMRADLDKLPPLPKMVDKINVAERFMYLDCVGMVAREGIRSMRGLTGGSKPEGMIDLLMDSAARVAVDWDHVLRMGNPWYDRMAEAFNKPTRAERQKAFHKINDDVRKLAASAKDWKSQGLLMLSGPRYATSELIGKILVSLLLPAVSTASDAEDRATMQFDLTRLAFALAAYRADRGKYPGKLEDLVPKFFAELPKDMFNASEMHYRLEGGGYLLYSVGVNGKDDGGKGIDGRKEGEDRDDMAVRVQAATVKKE